MMSYMSLYYLPSMYCTTIEFNGISVNEEQ